MFGSVSEGGFVEKKEADSRCNLGLEKLNISLEGEFTVLHSREGTVGFEMVSDLFVNLAVEDFRKAGQDGYRSVIVWV